MFFCILVRLHLQDKLQFEWIELLPAPLRVSILALFVTLPSKAGAWRVEGNAIKSASLALLPPSLLSFCGRDRPTFGFAPRPFLLSTTVSYLAGGNQLTYSAAGRGPL